MFNIAIDGHVGSGKSTLAHELAKRLNFKVLDTGAIYRGIACFYLKQNLPTPTEEIINDFVNKITVKVEFIDNLQHVIVNDIDFTSDLRFERTSMMASMISPFPNLRKKVLAIQRSFAEKYNCVIEGRDIGTVVLPDAKVKLFITASELVRANRRYQQIKDKKDSPSYQEILEDLRARDYKDMNRKVAPLKPAEDSIIIDTSDMNLFQTVDYCEKIIRSKM